jgi:hypothetical protein
MDLYHSMQTLTTLNLAYNVIGDKGAEYLANALQHNTVSLVSNLLILNRSVSFDVGTYYVNSF